MEQMEELKEISSKFTFTTEGLPPLLQSRVSKLISLLNEPEIPLKQLMALIQNGIPDEVPKIREVCWKLLLGYLPTTKSKWQETIDKNNKNYQEFVNNFLPQERYPEYPLIIDRKHERWAELQDDFELWEQIQKDTSRTHSDLAFYSQQTKPIMIPFLTGARKEKFRLMNGQNQEKYEQFMKSKELQRVTYRYHIMSRILFVYSKLNPSIKYVQGMNEILAPIYYLVNGHKSIEEQEESCCFLMLNNAMSTIIELHIKDLDESETGITGKLKTVNEMLFVVAPTIWKRLNDLKIDPFYYCFRWMTLLYAQQFQMFDVIRLWESIFSRSNRIQYMNFVAIAILINKKELIMENQFIKVLEQLQNLKFQSDIREIIQTSNKLEKQWKDTDFDEVFARNMAKMKSDKK